jgi:nitrogen regulatory protein PII
MSISRISIHLFRSLAKDVVKSLNQIGIEQLTELSGRSPVLQESKGLLALLSGSKGLSDDPSVLISFTVPSEKEDDLINYIIEKGQLDLPGRGTVYAEVIDLPMSTDADSVNQPVPFSSKTYPTLKKAVGICCIVQRGEGNKVAQLILESGAAVPNITYGTGLGVRDKMGLLRITIPADKELVWVAVSHFDADILMDSIIEVVKLDQPGKGFIYSFPISQAMLNMQVTRDEGRSAASIEQVVAAIDEIKGDIEWRRRATTIDRQQRHYLKSLIELTLVCDEGGADELIAAAMSAGAPGASISKMKQLSPQAGNSTDSISKSRECCYLIVAKDSLPAILKSLSEGNAFEGKHHSVTMSQSTLDAFTYIPKN